MPKKGLQRCACGADDWLPVSIKQQQASMVCQECGVIKVTRSVGGIQELTELAEAMHSIERYEVTKIGQCYEIRDLHPPSKTPQSNN